LPDGVGEHLAQGCDDVAHRAGRLAVGFERGDQPVNVLGAERGKRPLTELRGDVLAKRTGRERSVIARWEQGTVALASRLL
jgi:hypothetical protein